MQPNEAQQAALPVSDDALLSVDVFAAALAEIENSGPVPAKPPLHPKPARSAATDPAPEQPADPAPAVAPEPAAAPEPIGDLPEAAATPPATESVAPAVDPAPAEPEIAPSAVAEPADGASTATEPRTEPAPPPAPAEPKAPAAPGLKFKIGMKGAPVPTRPPETASAAPAAVAGAAPAAASALDLPSLSPTVRLGKRIIRWAERTLDAVHRPLEQLSPKLLPIMGVFALTTIGVSALSLIALPVLFPSQDAISYLDERVAALDAPKPEKPKPEADGHGSEKPKKDAAAGHGDAKPKKKEEGGGHGAATPKKEEPAGHGEAAKTEAKAPAAKPGGAKKTSSPKKPAGSH